MTLRVAVKDLSVLRRKGGMSFELRAPVLNVFAGQSLAVLGASGCGKYTLLDVLALALAPTGAARFTLHPDGGQSVDLLNADAATLARLRGAHIGYVLQSGGLLSFLSVRNNILLPGQLLGLDRRLLQERLAFLCDRLNIADQLDKKPQHLSGGQRQRVAIARALIHAPLVVLADEPTAAVDQRTAADICAVFGGIVRETGAALIVVSHDAALVRGFADQVACFHVERLSPQSVLSTLRPESDTREVH